MYKAEKPGHLVGVDMMEVSKSKRVIVLIDYFSRLVFTKYLCSKDVVKTVGFIADTYKKFKFERLLCDNGGEFNNKVFKEWVKKENIELEVSVPYYHPSNGRVERVIRTLREALKRTKGPLKTRLKEATETYNKSYHRGINTTPLEALKTENWMDITNYANKYQKEFFKCRKLKNLVLKSGDEVLIRNEVRKSKMEPIFKEKGKILREVYKNVYEVITEKGIKKIRHITQLKCLGPGMLETVSPATLSVVK
jgi:hypothetical protein